MPNSFLSKPKQPDVPTTRDGAEVLKRAGSKSELILYPNGIAELTEANSCSDEDSVTYSGPFKKDDDVVTVNWMWETGSYNDHSIDRLIHDHETRRVKYKIGGGAYSLVV